MKGQFVTISKQVFGPVQKYASSAASVFAQSIKGFGIEVVNSNLFSSQQIQTMGKYEEIGSLIAKSIVAKPEINFNIGALYKKK
jgi:hypothetical protein